LYNKRRCSGKVPVVYVYLRDKLFERLYERAKEKGVPVSRLVAEILEEWVRQRGKEEVQDRA